MLQIITWLILIFGILNLFRLMVYMLAADYYDVANHNKFKKRLPGNKPHITVLIPAYNEELTIEKTVRSVIRSKYRNRDVIVIDDGSADQTSEVVKSLIKRFPRSNIQLLRQANAGKGAALNNGISHAKGELIMVLDADSEVDKDALGNSIKYFDDKKVKAVASRVKLKDSGSWLGLVQRMEYLLAYRMKRSLTALNIEYIIGGVGSIYRKSTLKQVSGYRTNTITEDIDLSMKVIARGNKAYRVVYASDVGTTTEPVHSIGELISQRYRWKFGRLQAFVRYRKLFMSNKSKYSKLYTWYQLPYTIFGELYLILEPIFFSTIIFVTFFYGDSTSLPLAMAILSGFMAFNILAADNETWPSKLALIYLTPVIYLLLPVLSFVELSALVLSLKNWRELKPDYQRHGSWKHVTRKPVAQQS